MGDQNLRAAGDIRVIRSENRMPTDNEVTTIINRRIKKGRSLEYANWFGRMVEAAKKFPGFRGISVIVPGSDPDARIILYRFSDIATQENWEKSEERNVLLAEVDELATQVYEKAAGLETWFNLPVDSSK
jgi:uncharacterized protein